MRREVELCIAGAGAAGLWAAGVAARRGARVLLLEKTRRTGTKVLASGGARCNLTTTLGPEDAARLFRVPGERFLRHAFRVLPPLELRRRFERLGVPTREAPLEKVFPASGRARDVRDALEREARAAGAELLLEAPVAELRPADGGWLVRGPGELEVRSQRLFLCTGGMSYPRTGTTGEGYAWLERLGLSVVPPAPALVPLASPEPWVRELAGVSWQEGALRLLDPRGKLVARRERPLLFTHAGLSGPGALDLSVHVARGARGLRWSLQLDLFPGIEREELRARLVEAASARGAPRLSRVLPERVPRRLVAAACARAGIARDPAAQALSKAQRHALIETLKGLPIAVEGTLGFDQAEVTTGGLELRAVGPASMEVARLPGLYVFGELLDLDGPIGGLNFQAAFACGEVAALHATRERAS